MDAPRRKLQFGTPAVLWLMVTLGMMLERGAWRIQQVGFNIAVKLDDPEFLKALQKSATQHAGMSDEITAMSTLRRFSAR